MVSFSIINGVLPNLFSCFFINSCVKGAFKDSSTLTPLIETKFIPSLISNTIS